MLQKFHCEHVLEELGGCGRYQKLLMSCVIFPLAILAALQSSTMYNELLPDHWCQVKALLNFSYGEQHRLIRPRLGKADLDARQRGAVQLSNCDMYDIDYDEVSTGLVVVVKSGHNESTNIPTVVPIPTRECTNGWVYNQQQYKQSAAMHYDFVCQYKNGMQRVKMLRQVSSAALSLLYAFFADKFGRKVGILLVLFAFMVSAVSPLFTTNYYAFLATQSLNGSVYPMSIFFVLVLGIEFMPVQHRSNVLLISWIAFHLGEWISFLIAETISDWVVITAINSFCVLPCLLLVFFATDETPQWVLAVSKDAKRLKEIFEKLNRVNDAKMDEDSMNSIISKFTHFANHKDQREQQKVNERQTNRQTIVKSRMEQFRSRANIASDNDSDTTEHRPAVFARVKLFLKRSTLFQMILLFSFVLLTNDLTIDFMHRERAKFDDNIIIDSFFGSLIKMPAILLTWYLIEQRIGRRWSNCTILLLNEVVLVGALLTRLFWLKKVPWLDATIFMLGVMLAECSSITTILQVIELSPTRYRMIVLALTYSLGKVTSTGLVYAFNLNSLRILFNVYTRLTILLTLTLLSILIASFVAETRNEFLPLGLLASEQLITSVCFWSLSKKKSDITPSNLFLSMSKWDINSNHQIIGSIKHMEKFTDS